MVLKPSSSISQRNIFSKVHEYLEAIRWYVCVPIFRSGFVYAVEILKLMECRATGMLGEEEKPESSIVEATASRVTKLPLRIAQEHSYSRLVPFRSSSRPAGRYSFPTFTLFPDRVRKREKSVPEPPRPTQVDQGESR